MARQDQPDENTAGNSDGDADVGVPPSDRVSPKFDHDRPPRLDFPVVGLGASAGGIEACIEFLEALPPDTGMAFVIVQHLAPDRESLVADILAKHTKMPVLEVEDGTEVEPDHVYVIRPARTMTIDDGRLRLSEPLEKRGHRRPVDDFFRSLASEQRERAIGVILSGMGSNGTAGAQHIKAVGGICVAQSPESARYPSMPRHLIDAELADYVLRPGQIPEALQRYASHPYVKPGRAEAIARDDRSLNEILAVLRTRTRRDFSGYKKPTILRRILRRMGLHHIESMHEYAMLLRQNMSEASALADDLVIHVTGFFRDPDAWRALYKRVIVPLVADRENGTALRAWVTACSTGEEAYSLAILLSEAAQAAEKDLDIKIFATDLSDRVLGTGRSGMFAAGIESDVSPEQLERFFDKEDAQYRVKKELREMVVFAPQDLLHDPPFSRIDLCSCRNLLIYLEPEMQRRVINLLHFGLRESGALFLGNSETIGGLDELFEPIEGKHRIFRKVGTARRPLGEFPRLQEDRPQHHTGGARIPARITLSQSTQRALLDRFAPPSVVIDRQQRAVYFHGDTTAFLSQPQGEPTRDLIPMAREGIRGSVRLAVGRAVAEQTEITIEDGVINSPEGSFRVIVTARPLDVGGSGDYFLVSFARRAEPAPAPNDADAEDADPLVTRELHRVRDELQRTVDELQTRNEELKAANEEVTSVNEEFQSTNEELETSKEELQSLNEELVTVNSQLRSKMEELEQSTNDLSSLLSSTDIAVIFLDTRFRIRRFTPATRALIDLIPSDIGRPLGDLAPKFTDPDLLDDAKAVLERLVPIDREIGGQDDRWYVRRVLPYRTVDNRIEGVVITFVDITRRRRAEAARAASELSYRQTFHSIRDHAIVMVDTEGVITGWCPAAEDIIGFSEDEMVGRHVRVLFTEEDQKNGVPERELAKAAATGTALDERWHRRKNGNRYWASGTMSSLRDDGDEIVGFVKILRDLTGQKELTDRLEEARAAAQAAADSKDQFIAVISHELRTPLSVILMWCRMLQQSEPEPSELEEALHAIERSAEGQSRLVEDLLDVSRIAAGKMRLEPTPEPLGDLVEEVTDAMRPTIEAKGLRCDIEVASDVGVVRCDGRRIQQVISNLLSNAIKFTPADGAITVRVRREGTFVEIIVTDTGAGIDPDFVPRLFDRFAQGDSSSDRAQTGLGLGLSIVKSIVELHDGVVVPRSEGPGKGATFVVRMPLPETDAAVEPHRAEPPARPGTLAGHKILLVEDQPDAAAVIALTLRRAGAAVVHAISGRHGLKMFEPERPAAIVSDIGMPDMDGLDFIRQARIMEARMERPPVPALALTAFGSGDVERQAFDAGYNAFLVKPSDPSRLIAEIERLLEAQADAEAI